MINVGRIVNSPKFSQSFTVWRKTGGWVEGRFVETEVSISMIGVVTAAGTKDIIQVPEGDRTSQLMVFHSRMPLFVSHDDIQGRGTSDQIEWHNERYRLFQIKDWSEFGYFKAFGTSMGGV